VGLGRAGESDRDAGSSEPGVLAVQARNTTGIGPPSGAGPEYQP